MYNQLPMVAQSALGAIKTIQDSPQSDISFSTLHTAVSVLTTSTVQLD